ncbi:bifunctional hydroxymethylpyrimidine kinase/phosphomethylpyrimidine kinase [Mesorhizobium sp. VK2D]|nr:bifunctional hydroxymethylpyrimidine kinase/phosphomethylpyrimidine kinase [Mesorhizobium sp. VK2D]MDX8458036.1 bifunctional hydroxymethylpyrimidine kinase/phosphomethylpyrimidine kinase [Mesorhizobium sp. VK2D]
MACGRAAALLIKGGHAAGATSTDMLLTSDGEPVRFDMLRLAGSMRGTGCMLASAIAAHQAKAKSIESSVRDSKRFVFEQFLKSSIE